MTETETVEADARRMSANLSRQIRDRRRQQGLSLDALAIRAGLAKGTVVALEGGRANPSIGVLCRIAAALSLSVRDLVTPATTSGTDSLIEKARPATLWQTAQGSQATLTALTTGSTMFELWRWSLAPGDRYEADAHSPGTRELISVESGSLEITVNDQTLRLSTGDAAVLLTDHPHAYAAAGEAPAQFTMAVLEIAPAL